MLLSELAERVGGELSGDGNIEISGVADIREARPGHVTFVGNPKFETYLRTTQASAVILADASMPTQAAVIRNPNPYLAFQKAMQILHGDRYMPPKGIHPTAVIGRGVRLGDRISIGPYVVIEDDAVIEDDVVVRAGSFIGAETTVGEGSYIYPNAVVRERTRIGRNNIIHAGAVIGDDGFGFVKEGEQHRKMPQLGRTILGDNVEIGSNACIDRATIGETVVGDGSRIDNLVQIGHNVRVGRNVVLCAQVGIAGSCEIGDEVTMAGQVGVSGHLEIGKGTKIGAQAGVIKHIPPLSRVSGYPARPHTEAMRTLAATRRLPELLRRVEELEARLAALEAPGSEPKR